MSSRNTSRAASRTHSSIASRSPFAALAIALSALSSGTVAAQEPAVEEVLVLGDATLASDFSDVGNFQRIDGDVLARTG